MHVLNPLRGSQSLPSRRLLISVAAAGLAFLGADPAMGTIIATSGSVALESSPYPGPSDSEIFAFDEQQSVAFVATQALDFGSIAAGTLVNSHYIQYNTASATGSVGPGTVTFDGPILGVVTTTADLDADLSPDAVGTSDSYFGLAGTLGAYPAGAPGTEQFRGLGSPLDSLSVVLGSNTLTINGLDIETPGALDGIRVLTLVPEPGSAGLFALGLVGLLARGRRKPRSQA